MRGRAQKLRAQAIQREQQGLVKVENILIQLLAKVNESINELKVEELHLKSSLIEYCTVNQHDDQPSTSAQAAIRLNTTPFISEKDHLHIQQPDVEVDMDGIENINKQTLALESLLVPLTQKKYNDLEEEEDDDEDDDYLPSENEESENDELKEY